MSEEHTTAPLQVLLSKNFGGTIRHAMSLAIAREHDAVTSEHLLLALADDPDAAAVMRACGVDLDTMRGRSRPHWSANPPRRPRACTPSCSAPPITSTTPWNWGSMARKC